MDHMIAWRYETPKPKGWSSKGLVPHPAVAVLKHAGTWAIFRPCFIFGSGLMKSGCPGNLTLDLKQQLMVKTSGSSQEGYWGLQSKLPAQHSLPASKSTPRKPPQTWSGSCVRGKYRTQITGSWSPSWSWLSSKAWVPRDTSAGIHVSFPSHLTLLPFHSHQYRKLIKERSNQKVQMERI